MKEKKEFYSVPELAGLMHMSRVGVFKKVQKGEIKAKKIGKSYAIPSSEADQFITHEEPAKYGEVVIFKPEKGMVEIEVKIKKDTVWINQNQMSELFGRDKSVISRHIDNVFEEGELGRGQTVASFATVQNEGSKSVERMIEHYNLDVIISVGYRVKSQAGIQFRIWATDTLKKYMLNGYAINEKLLNAEMSRFEDLRRIITFIGSKAGIEELAGQEKALLNILNDYAGSLSTLLLYDENRLEMPRGTKAVFELNYGECVEIISKTKDRLSKKGEAGELFGLDNKKRLEGIIKSVYQTFQGEDLYKTAEEKAAHILYFVIKDHPFSDGNKRLASLFFIYFLKKNRLLDGKNGLPRINQSGLAAIALLVAASAPKEKDIMVRLIANLIF